MLGIILGSVVGFSVFTLSVVTMDGIIFRPTSEGKLKFTCKVFKEYIKAPLALALAYKTTKFYTVWGIPQVEGNSVLISIKLLDRMKLLQLNWIAMVSIGIIIISSIVYLYNLQ